MSRISYSQISLFNECPHHWKLRYVDKIAKFESNIHLLFGTAMHEVIQHYLDVMYEDTIKKADEIDVDKMLMERMKEGFVKAKEEEGKEPCTIDDMKEFYVDGVTILDWFKRRRGDYFSKKGYKLIGCEVPIEYDLPKGITMVGYLDIVIHDTLSNTIKIMDIKTSTRGWNKWMKKDENKTQQLLLYKKFYSQQYDFPIEDIEVEYFIVKRKLYENVDFPQKRVQKFSPASGTVSMNKVGRKLTEFMEQAFDDEGKHLLTPHEKRASKKACRFCEFNQTEYCDKGIK